MISVLFTAVSEGRFISLFNLGRRHHPLYEDGISDAMVIYCDRMQRCKHHFKRAEDL